MPQKKDITISKFGLAHHDPRARNRGMQLIKIKSILFLKRNYRVKSYKNWERAEEKKKGLENPGK